MATIFCFTSTGNSLYVARKIAEGIGGRVTPMRPADEGLAICDDEVVGFVLPVYFWGLPRMVERFITELQISNKDAYVFAVVTYGGMAWGVLGWIKKLLAAKGIYLHYGVGVKSVDNYIPAYRPKDSEGLRRTVNGKIAKIIRTVTARTSKRIPASTFLNKLVYRSFPGKDSDQYFTVSSACTGCATCQKVCPAHNISIASARPIFHHDCEHCMACLQNCSALAIDWMGKTQGKERFRNAGITLDDLIAFNREIELR